MTHLFKMMKMRNGILNENAERRLKTSVQTRNPSHFHKIYVFLQ